MCLGKFLQVWSSRLLRRSGPPRLFVVCNENLVLSLWSSSGTGPWQPPVGGGQVIYAAGASGVIPPFVSWFLGLWVGVMPTPFCLLAEFDSRLGLAIKRVMEALFFFFFWVEKTHARPAQMVQLRGLHLRVELGPCVCVRASDIYEAVHFAVNSV